MGAFTSVLNLVRPSGAVSGVEGGLERGVTESSKAHSTRTDQASHGSSQGSDTTKAHRSMRTKEYISNHMVLEETIRDGASDGWPKAIAQQLLRENPRIYRLFSYENDRLYVHMAQKIEAKSKILRLIDDKSAALTELQAPAGAQVRQQGNAGLEAKRLYTRLAPEQQLTLKQWVEQAQHHPEQQTRMRQELAQEEDQCFKELGILLQPYRDFLISMATLRKFSRVERDPCLSHIKALTQDVDLHAPENDFLLSVDDCIRTDDHDLSFGLYWVMHSESKLAKAIRWWLETIHPTEQGNESSIRLDTARWRRSWTVVVLVGFVLVLLVPAATMLALDLSTPLSLGVVTLSGVVVVVAATTIRAQPVEALFLIFCSYLAVVVPVVMGLDDDRNKRFVALTDVCSSAK